jgi:ATP adenylyltransferase
MRQERTGETLKTVNEQICAFCKIDPELSSVLLQSEYFYLRQDKFPVTPGHLLIIPKRHVTSPSNLNKSEWHDLRVILEEACSLLKTGDNQITGFNVGINIGSDAGQTIPHLHVHVIPRRPKDIPNSKCGVRMINPAKADYRATD